MAQFLTRLWRLKEAEELEQVSAVKLARGVEALQSQATTVSQTTVEDYVSQQTPREQIPYAKSERGEKSFARDQEFINIDNNTITIGNTLESSTHRPYTYKALSSHNHIRVLLIESLLDRVFFSLEHLDLSKHLHGFETVSYVWGPKYRDHYLSFKDGSYLKVTLNLARALRDLCHCSETKYLWIDQLSIQQEDTKERSQQVQAMGRIYRDSRRVLIYLHLPDATETHLQSLFDLLNESTQPLSSKERAARLEKSISFKPWQQPGSYDMWQAIVAVLRNAWFSRAWRVFQEAVLPGTAFFVIHGRLISFESFFQIIFLISKMETQRSDSSRKDSISQSSGFSQLYAMARLRADYTKQIRKVNFLELLSDIAPTCLCSVPVDCVYAFHGLLDRQNTKQILQVDYSLHVDEVMMAFTRFIIEDSRSLAVFGLSDRGPYFASWVCNWKRPALTIPLWSFSRPTKFDAAKGEEFTTYDARDSDLLRCRGIVADNIISVFEPFTSSSIWSQRCPDEFLNLRGAVQHFAQYGNSLQHLGHWNLEARLLRVALADGVLLFEQRGYATWPKDASNWLLFNDLQSAYKDRSTERDQGRTLSATLNTLVERRRETLELLLNLSRIAFGRRICLTESGKLGLVPAAAKAGDTVAVLFGSKVPLILRKRRVAPFAPYLLLGQAYIEDMMSGEVLASPETEAKTIILE